MTALVSEQFSSKIYIYFFNSCYLTDRPLTMHITLVIHAAFTLFSGIGLVCKWNKDLNKIIAVQSQCSGMQLSVVSLLLTST